MTIERARVALEGLSVAAPRVNRAVVAVDYGGPWPGLLAKLKFQGATALANPLAQLLAEAVCARRGVTSLIVPVPLSKQRLRERGYTPSWLLAKQVGRRLDIPARMDVLERSRHTQRLMSLSAEERLRQIRDAFHVSPRALATLTGQDVAMVDDVKTNVRPANARVFLRDEKLAALCREGLDIAPLAVRIQRVENKARFARSARARHHRQFAGAQVEVEVLEVVLPGAADADQSLGHSVGLFLSRPNILGTGASGRRSRGTRVLLLPRQPVPARGPRRPRAFHPTCRCCRRP